MGTLALKKSAKTIQASSMRKDAPRTSPLRNLYENRCSRKTPSVNGTSVQ
jgi:hypothetical protein